MKISAKRAKSRARRAFRTLQALWESRIPAGRDDHGSQGCHRTTEPMAHVDAKIEYEENKCVFFAVTAVLVVLIEMSLGSRFT
ncbi:MAG: hypothetical protein MI923_07060 [Phycisphaerales bacterium]|nr:hypothetical protein [Phycisphaerales bacterium]